MAQDAQQQFQAMAGGPSEDKCLPAGRNAHHNHKIMRLRHLLQVQARWPLVRRLYLRGYLLQGCTVCFPLLGS